ncbi:oxidoreductase [Roseomonas sp. GC11]|uniref:oxidoreductase n=1 Tax=Roseomonas sp. GC11 TaxID=2950546 RepID=UPI00210D8146|nr:oxidoreductase [Roseomonas sp. GC11]MCQ4161645.1 oxidoreductase [Roseomonas sp. GC11]
MSMAHRGVALVTGASAGIGKATAAALLAAGYRVFGTSRNPAPETAPGITLLPCDVTDDASVAAMVAEVMRQAGRIDLLVNNAGAALIGAAEETSIDQAKALFDLNLFGVVRTTQAVLPIMRGQRSGRIVNISSVVGFLPSPYAALYAATKHAVEGYSESLDHEVRTLGIRVLLVEPAFTRTALDRNAPKPDRPLPVYEAARAAMTAVWNSAIQDGDTPETVAATVVAAATAPAPRLRNPAGRRASQLHVLRRFVPAGMFDKSLRGQMKLPT